MAIIEHLEKVKNNEIDLDSYLKEKLEQIHQVHDKLNCCVTICDDAKILDGELKGLLVAVKDNFNTKGIRTTASSRILDDYVPIYDATVIKKLKAAGATIVCKTSLDELGMGGTNKTAYTGAVCNPYDFDRIPGGSSGGSAALTASGIIDFALGSDTGDSVRKPASYCGLVGMKPTYGRISRYGVIPYASSLDHVAYFTRSVKDSALMLKYLAGRDDLDLTSSNREVEDYLGNLNSDMNGKKICVVTNIYEGISNDKVKENFDLVIAKLKERGAIVDFVELNQELMMSILPVYHIIANAEATANHSNLDGIRFGIRENGNNLQEIMTNSRTKGFGELIRRRFVMGSYSLAEENQEYIFRKAQKVRRLIVDEYLNCLKEYDAILTIASGDVAPHIENNNEIDKLSSSYMITENHLAVGNFGGLPSITVPSGMIDGLPIGVNITCRHFDCQTCFDVAKAIEECMGLEDIHAEVL